MTAPLEQKQWLRRVFARFFARMNPGDITIKHPFTHEPFFLHSFRHKGYWFYGKRREPEAMAFLQELVVPGATVIEVGAHIGFVTLFLAELVGPAGQVLAFEPGENNLPYLRRNCASHSNIRILPFAVGGTNGARSFYLEDLSGQNNSFVPQYEGLTALEQGMGLRAHVQETTVQVVTLDAFCAENALAPGLIKIDAEGAEWEILKGAARTLARDEPKLLVEMNARQAEMFEFLGGYGYRFFTEDRRRLDSPVGVHYNVFCLPRSYTSVPGA